ncbi:hypothetical protein D9M71_231680 [compost metagenome]
MAFIVANYDSNVAKVSVGSVPFLELFGVVAGGWQLALSAQVAQRRLDEDSSEQDFYQAKLLTARFYAQHLLSRASGLAQSVVHGGDAALEMDDQHF